MYQIAIDPVSVFTNLNQNLLKMGFAILIFLVGFILGNISGKLLYKFLKEIEVNSILKNLTGYKNLTTKIGRALPCRFIYGKYNNKFQNYKTTYVNDSKQSIMEYFNFAIANLLQ